MEEAFTRYRTILERGVGWAHRVMRPQPSAIAAQGTSWQCEKKMLMARGAEMATTACA
jgi:hypothetical protein